eukprot:CAMPEP_0114424564 /NCGR_PEP_ID=MMETSP0103-20121206/6762_1 /TAXON_ID=37642 ORGANISM="Paraphysomonas imperforata, Strain PA2" /NCGR_SAMPLE_ID=MMETSP0103 /ASSEMBLY_ACC=CAM_ASM_000201 /LENGTH=163 /DNA_ID=CAMNT_0001593327 /DNA_START=200 /DNA_END=688 /DNA_ORIENTATION=-
MAYCLRASSLVLVPKWEVAGVRRSERICRLNELGWGMFGPGPQVSEGSNRGALPMTVVEAVPRCLLLITCLPRLDVCQGVRKSDPPLAKSTLGFAGRRVDECCNFPVYCFPVEVIDMVLFIGFVLEFIVLLIVSEKVSDRTGRISESCLVEGDYENGKEDQEI